MRSPTSSGAGWSTTSSGDAGATRLADGTRVPKHDTRVEAYGAVDELNAPLGLV